MDCGKILTIDERDRSDCAKVSVAREHSCQEYGLIPQHKIAMREMIVSDYVRGPFKINKLLKHKRMCLLFNTFGN